MPRWRALRVMARSRLLVITSRSEGGANVLSEALASGVPVLSSRIPGSTGVLGGDYPGLFAVGDTHGLAALFERAETDAEFRGTLDELVPAPGPPGGARARDARPGGNSCATACVRATGRPRVRGAGAAAGPDPRGLITAGAGPPVQWAVRCPSWPSC